MFSFVFNTTPFWAVPLLLLSMSFFIKTRKSGKTELASIFLFVALACVIFMIYYVMTSPFLEKLKEHAVDVFF
ncbi:MAG: hypothetical protein H6621_12770 [Halobacteriovoraceae bacterium]|nr:hypothetical protein [Halobacteriovoraceae bacterium]MCB9095934.1 hypothetical protein [Halobacteriovoraceae bacterium]